MSGQPGICLKIFPQTSRKLFTLVGRDWRQYFLIATVSWVNDTVFMTLRQMEKLSGLWVNEIFQNMKKIRNSHLIVKRQFSDATYQLRLSSHEFPSMTHGSPYQPWSMS